MNRPPVPAPLLEVRDLVRSFDVSPPWLARITSGAPRAFLRAVDGVSFDLMPGRTLAIVGESGCGKSTLARCVAGLLMPTAGSIRYKTVDIGRIAEGKTPYRPEIQMIFQDPYGSLNPRWKVGRIVADPILALGLAGSRAEARRKVDDLLVEVGLSSADAEKYPHEFSGGQRQRIAIARALATSPALVVCDEPTSALDVSVQAQILNLMRDLQEEHRLSYLFISHNLAVVDHMANDVAVMYLGRIVEIAARDVLFERPRHPYTRKLIEAAPTLDHIGKRHETISGEVPNPLDPPGGCAFHPRCAYATDTCRAERPALRRLGASDVACHRAEDIG